MDRMTIAEKLDYTHRRLLSSVDVEQEMAIWNEFLVPLGRGETFPEMVRYFTTRLEDVIAKLRQITAQNKPPGYLSRLEIPQLWNTLAWTLIERKLPSIGRDLLVAMYEFQLLQQGDMRRRFYKGFSLQNLGWANYLLGDETQARKVVRLALLEEVFNTLEMDVNNQLRIVASNPAYLMLRQPLRCSAIELNNFISFARDFARRSPERCFYPEDCYASYLRNTKTSTINFSASENTYISNFNYTYFYSLMDIFRRVNNVEALEPYLADIVLYLFNSVADFIICEENISHNNFGLVVRNNLVSETLIINLGHYLAIEWRYWFKEIHVEDLLLMASKLRLTGIKTLVLFVRDMDANGSFDVSPLKTTIQGLYGQEKINMIVITQTDLLEIERRNTNLLALMKAKIEELKFGQLMQNDKRSNYELRRDFSSVEARPQIGLMPNQPPMQMPQNHMTPMVQNQMMPNQMMPNQMMPNQMMPMVQQPPMQMPPQMIPNQIQMPQNQMPTPNMAIMPMPPNQMPPVMPNQIPQGYIPSTPAMIMSPNAVIPPVPNQMVQGAPMPITPGQVPIAPNRQDVNSFSKPPRLVIRSTTKKLTENPDVNAYKPMVIKPNFQQAPVAEIRPSFQIKPSFDSKSGFDGKPSFEIKSSFESSSASKSAEIQILKPCTSCQNQTSLSCKACNKPFCNVHINMSSLKCEGCLNPLKPEEDTDITNKLE